jgi:peptidyl-prolyl cis-trans isomerase C
MNKISLTNVWRLSNLTRRFEEDFSVIISPVLHKTAIIKIFLICCVLLLITGCKPRPDSENSQLQSVTQTPSPTEAPMAARVNGEGILLSDYEAELKRYQAGLIELGQDDDPATAKEEVLKVMTNQVLLAQAAIKQGYTADEAALLSRLSELAAESGGEEALNTWMSKNFYSDESFSRALALDMAAVWMRNKIISEVPQTADQVHARQILVANENEAFAVERQLQVGASFETLAFEYDPLTGGDLGWFPSGYLLQPDVEKAAFSLQAGQFSGIIPTSYGYHIVFVIDHDGQHPLSPEALLFVQRSAFEKWLADERAKSAIEILIP